MGGRGCVPEEAGLVEHLPLLVRELREDEMVEFCGVPVVRGEDEAVLIVSCRIRCKAMGGRNVHSMRRKSLLWEP